MWSSFPDQVAHLEFVRAATSRLRRLRSYFKKMHSICYAGVQETNLSICISGRYIPFFSFNFSRVFNRFHFLHSFKSIDFL